MSKLFLASLVLVGLAAVSPAETTKKQNDAKSQVKYVVIPPTDSKEAEVYKPTESQRKELNQLRDQLISIETQAKGKELSADKKAEYTKIQGEISELTKKIAVKSNAVKATTPPEESLAFDTKDTSYSLSDKNGFDEGKASKQGCCRRGWGCWGGCGFWGPPVRFCGGCGCGGGCGFATVVVPSRLWVGGWATPCGGFVGGNFYSRTEFSSNTVTPWGQSFTRSFQESGNVAPTVVAGGAVVAGGSDAIFYN